MKAKQIVLKMAFMVLLCLASLTGWSQENIYSGKVTDLNGDPLPGVNILEKGTGNGVISNLDGEFSINVSNPDAILVFSYVGFLTEEVPVNGKAYITVNLVEDITNLEEVVVVGYGTQKKINLTGAVATVGADELEERPVADVSQAIQGLVPNLAVMATDGGRPGSSMNWQIRGTGSIGGASSEPLIIIDGVPGNPDILNPDDIENISILKDAAASAIYGSRAPYGVVIITTKKGKSGQMKVNYSSLFSLRSPTKMLDKMGSLDFMEYMNTGMENMGQAPYFDEEYFEAVRANIANPELPDILPDPNNPLRWGRYIAADTDWFEEVYKSNALSQNHGLSLTGGTENTTYYVSLGYLNQNGLYRYGDDEYNRYSGLVNLHADATKWLELNYRLQAARRLSDQPVSDQQYEAFRRWPVDPVYDPNGNFTSKAFSLHIAAEGGRKNSVDDAFNNTFGLVFKPFEGLKINTDFTYNTHNEIYRANNKILYEYGPEENVVGAQRDASNTYIEKRFDVNKFYNTNIYANYTKEIQDHYFEILAGFQQEYNHWNRLRGYRDDLVNENIQALSSATGTDIVAEDGETEWATQGYFARFNYNFAGKYLLEINGRYDGSSRFPEEKRWGLFPSASIGYNISRENFFVNTFGNKIDMLKLRASYGKLGNSNVESNYYSPSMSKKQTDFLGPDGVYLDYISAPGFGNYLLTWEKPTTINIGVDFSIFSNKLQVYFDWYERTTVDMVGPQEPLPSVLGASVPQSNNTEMKGTGFELTIKHKQRFNDFGYDIMVNLSHHEEEVVKYYNPEGYIHSYYEGKKLGEIWGYETKGFINSEDDLNNMDDQSQIGNGWGLGDIMYKDQNDDHIINEGSLTLEDHGDLIRVGNTTPDYEYNITASADYKGFDFRMFWRGMGHADWWPGSGQGAYQYYTDEVFFGVSDNKWNFTALNDHKDHWTPENHDAYYPKPLVQGGDAYRNIKTQTKYLQNRAFLRLKSVQLGYRLPENWVNAVKIQQARVYITGENLVTFTKLKIYDPETPGLIYPLQKIYSMGVKLTF